MSSGGGADTRRMGPAGNFRSRSNPNFSMQVTPYTEIPGASMGAKRGGMTSGELNERTQEVIDQQQQEQPDPTPEPPPDRPVQTNVEQQPSLVGGARNRGNRRANRGPSLIGGA